MILASTSIEKSKNEDRTLNTKIHGLLNEILFDFRFRCFQLPVSEKPGHFRFEVGTGNRKIDDAKGEGEIHTSTKFHSNLPCSFRGEEGSTLKKRDLVDRVRYL